MEFRPAAVHHKQTGDEGPSHSATVSLSVRAMNSINGRIVLSEKRRVGESFKMLAEMQDSQNQLSMVSAEEATGAISLLDLAEILDQHKIWVESGGESGVKADLCGVNLSHSDLTGVNLEGAFLQRANLIGADLSMANLRGASLVQADLREANLLGTELRGANLMGANLYGAEGVWVGRLGGTNLFDAILPETIAAFDSTKAISDASKVARWFYFLILGASLACIALIGMTTDVRLIVDASAIPVPRFPKIISMTSFYLGAPLVLFILYLRFHFLLLRLWGSMSGLPAVFKDGQTLEKDGPWYLMGLVRRHFRWMREGRSPFWVLETIVATVLAYWVVPATLFLFWLRYLVRQDFRGTLLHAFLLTLSVAAATCVPTIVARVLQPGDLLRQKSKNLLRLSFATARVALLTGCALLIFSLGVNHGLPSDSNIATQHSQASLLRWASEAMQSIGYRPYAELTEAMLSGPPPHGNWSEEALAAVPGAKLNEMNLRFARAYKSYLVNAKLWRANLEGAYLSEADMRGANLREAVLRDADFRSRPGVENGDGLRRRDPRQFYRRRFARGGYVLRDARERGAFECPALRRFALCRQSPERAVVARRSVARGHERHENGTSRSLVRKFGADGFLFG